MKKICFFTGTRADFGLMKGLIHLVQEDKELELQVVASGTHLSSEFGNTLIEILDEGIAVSKKIEIVLSSDSHVGVCKSMGLAFVSYSEAIEDLSPDIVVILGDRTEAFVFASCSLIAGVPIAHISGGEVTMGAYDDALRHSITKMSQLHFTSTEIYRKRVVQMGEDPDHVYNVGALGVDNIMNEELLTKDQLARELNKKLDVPYLLITYHPVTLENDFGINGLEAMLEALKEFPEYLKIFTMPNADKSGRKFFARLVDFQQSNDNVLIFKSLGVKKYLSALKYSSVVIGNSSSGFTEAPTLNVPSVDIGSRQKGRYVCQSIFSANEDKEDILSAIHKALMFRNNGEVDLPYGDGTAAQKMLSIIKCSQINKVTKSFFDIRF